MHRGIPLGGIGRAKARGMKSEIILEEKKKLEEKLRAIKAKMIRSVEDKRFFGLDRKVREVQKTYHLMGRV